MMDSGAQLREELAERIRGMDETELEALLQVIARIEAGSDREHGGGSQ